MKEYIERTAVEKFIEDGLNNSDKNKAFGHDAIEIMAEIHYMPAADVAPVRHGRWERRNMGLFDEDYAYVCSVCGEVWNLIDSTPEDNNMNYCPSCGALMDKEDEHEAG